MGILLTQVGDTGVILANYPLECPFIPGRFYLLENYRTSYFLRKGPGVSSDNQVSNPDKVSEYNNLPDDVVGSVHGDTQSNVFSDAYFGAKERIMFFAVAECAISNRVYSLDFPQDEIYQDPMLSITNRYDVNNPDPHYMGKIYNRKDLNLELEAGFDQRSVKFARWKLNADETDQRYTSWFEPSTPLFSTGNDGNNKVYGSATLKNTMQTYHLFGGVENRVIAESVTNASKPITSIPLGVKTTNYTQCIPSVANPIRFRKVSIGRQIENSTLQYGREKSNIVLFTPIDNTCENFVIGDDNLRASIDCQGASNNVIKSGFENNIICSEFTNSNASNFVKTNFKNNNIGFNFKNNIIKHQFMNNTVGNDFQQNDFYPNNFPLKNNKVENSNIMNGFKFNEIKNSIIDSNIGIGFVRNKLIGTSPIVRCNFVKPDIKDVEFNVVGYNDYAYTFKGFTSLTDKTVDNNYSNLEAGVVFPQANNITGNDPTKLNLNEAGFQIAGTFYLKPNVRPSSQNPTGTYVNLKYIEGAPLFNFNLIPVAWDAFGTADVTTKRYWDWVLNVNSVNTKLPLNSGPGTSYPVSLATEFLEIYSISNDQLQLGVRSFLNQPDAKYYAQITGQNNYFLQ